MLELSARLRRLVPGVPILLATVSTETVGAAKLIGAGVADVVPWPIAASETVATLRDSLRRSSTSGSVTTPGSPWFNRSSHVQDAAPT
jgi:DNA-binding response OmpR family regulator